MHKYDKRFCGPRGIAYNNIIYGFDTRSGFHHWPKDITYTHKVIRRKFKELCLIADEDLWDEYSGKYCYNREHFEWWD